MDSFGCKDTVTEEYREKMVRQFIADKLHFDNIKCERAVDKSHITFFKEYMCEYVVVGFNFE